MPLPPPVSRRTALAGTAALSAALAAGCTADGADPTPPRAAPRRAPEGPDVALAARVLGDERAMLERVQATVRRHPGLAAAVAGARSAHRAHVALLAEAVPSGTTPSGTPTPRGPQVPSRPAPALSALARAEERLAAAGRDGAVASQSGAFARVLASMAAAAAQQSVRLADAARARR